MEEAGVSGVHRPECLAGDFFGELSPGVTTYGIQIGYTPDTRRILLPPSLDRSVRPEHAGVSGPAGHSGVRQPETPGAVSDNVSISWAL